MVDKIVDQVSSAIVVEDLIGGMNVLMRRGETAEVRGDLMEITAAIARNCKDLGDVRHIIYCCLCITVLMKMKSADPSIVAIQSGAGIRIGR